MKVLSAEQIKIADKNSILNEPISSIDLMERAAEKCCEFFPPKGQWSHLVVICGIGNNGGDGLAIARLQMENFKSVRVLVLESSKNYSDNFKINLKRLQDENCNIQFVESAKDIYLREDELVVDAILGTGTSRPVEGFLAECIEVINQQAAHIIAIDLPSGMDSSQPTLGAIIKANLTLTIGAPKPAIFFQESTYFVGEWKLVEIYKDDSVFSQFLEAPELIDINLAKTFLKTREQFSNKGTFGKALIIAGSEGKYGAAILAARACMRSGVGLLTVQVPSNAVNLIHQLLPEALLKADENKSVITSISDFENFNSIGIGPGIGMTNETVDALIELLKINQKPMVLDADALNIIAEHPTLLTNLPENSILTPHPKEFERLFGPSENSFERLEKQIKHSAMHKIVIVCKGRYTTITSPDGKVYFNMSGNSGLAKGGSGDVLTGILTALLAQGYSPINAAVLGVFVHGHSAGLLAMKMHEAGILPSDVIENLPYAFKDIVGEMKHKNTRAQ